MNDGGSAFPMLSFTENGGVGQVCEPGMSLRDWFAGRALSCLGDCEDLTPDEIAMAANRLAEAMLDKDNRQDAESCQTKT